jgi:VWFA-related protein
MEPTMYRRISLAGILLLLTGLTPFGQQPPQPPVFSSRVELVVLHVRVKDKRGAYITNLPSEAFTILEDGHPQTVQFFAAEDAPVTVGLIIDSSASMFGVRERVTAAADAFAEHSNPNDELFALTFNEEVHAVLPADVPFTSDGDTLRAAVARNWPARGRSAVYDGVMRGLEYAALGRHPGKILVLISDGVDNASVARFQDVLEAAQASNTLIYTVALVDPLGSGADIRKLRQLADVTGGEMFQPRDVSAVGDALQRIARDIRHMYTLGYVPPDAPSQHRLRQLEVTIASSAARDPRVRTRRGYLLEGGAKP